MLLPPKENPPPPPPLAALAPMILCYDIYIYIIFRWMFIQCVYENETIA